MNALASAFQTLYSLMHSYVQSFGVVTPHTHRTKRCCHGRGWEGGKVMEKNEENLCWN